MTFNPIPLFSFLFSFLCVSAEDFRGILPYPGPSNHADMVVLKDSSIVTITSHNYFKAGTGGYDSAQLLLMRHSKNGELLYQKSFPDTVMVTDIQYCDNKIYLCGYITTQNQTFGFLSRLNICLDIEQHKLFRHNKRNDNHHYFNSIHKYSDSELLVNAVKIIPSDTGYNTTFMVDKDLNIKWHQTFIGGGTNFIDYMNEDIILWGTGYFPKSDNKQIFEAKRNMVIINHKGQITQQHIKDEHTDNAISFGWGVATEPSQGYCIVSESNLISNQLGGKLLKIKTNGDIMIEKNIFQNKNENCQLIRKININRYFVISNTQINIDSTVTNAYIIDTNLNVLKKKTLLTEYSYLSISCGESYKSGLLLGGSFRNAHDAGNAILYLIDTTLNALPKPTINLQKDSLCTNQPNGSFTFPEPELIDLSQLDLRKKLFHQSTISELNFNSIHLYPNPFNTSFSIKLDNELEVNVRIVTLCGEIIHHQFYSDLKTIDIDCNDFPSGTYFVQITTINSLTNKSYVIIKN